MLDSLSSQLLGSFPVSLAQTAGGGQLTRAWTDNDSIRLVSVIGAFIIAVVVLGVVILAVRRRMMRQESGMNIVRGAMDELRELHKAGKISQEEYDTARRKLAARVAGEVKKEVADIPRKSYAARIPRSAMPPRPGTPEALTAPPGYDLTGAPLPAPARAPRSDAGRGPSQSERGGPGGTASDGTTPITDAP